MPKTPPILPDPASVAAQLEDIANRLVAGVRDASLQRPINDATDSLLRLRDEEGVQLLARLGFQLLPSSSNRYASTGILKRGTAMMPFDEARDTAELRRIAKDLRSRTV